MKKRLSFGVIVLLTTLLAACGGGGKESTPASTPKSSKTPTQQSSSKKTTSEGPKKTVTDLTISLHSQGEKAYITVKGTQQNYTADDFKWAWGIADQSGNFADGKANPADSDFVKATFDESNQFSLDYCLTDIATLKAGTLYQIYGGTPETYAYIPFASNMFGASDASRNYYLRQDQNNDLIFESVQPISFATAEVVNVAQADLPEGITNPGAYLKIGGANSKNLTLEQIKAWDDANNIAGDFQRVIPSWQQHMHAKDERFYTIEGGNVYFYLYCDFIEANEGWMVHFDVVSGATNAGLKTTTTYNGETTYQAGEKSFKVYSNQTSDEEHYWGCVGVYRVA